MKKLDPLHYFPLFLVLLIGTIQPTTIFSQVLTANDGFEGQSQKNIPPADWYNCDDVSSVDTQPGIMENYKEASQGQTYISLVTREFNPPGTVETAWAELKIPFLKDSCYRISLDISLTSEFNGSYNWETYYFDNPCILQIIGFNGSCDNMDSSEILWESDVLSNFEWQTFNITILPLLEDYNRIALRANFTQPDNHQNSAILVDNLKIQDTTGILLEDTGSFSLPSWASGIQWYYEGVLIEGETSHQLPFSENGEYQAQFQDKNGCLLSMTKIIEIDYNNAILYPSPTSDEVTIQFYSFSEKSITFEIYNDVGQLIATKERLVKKGINKSLLSLGTLAPGLYFIKMRNPSNSSKSFKVVVGQL